MYSDVIIGFDGSASGHDALALGRQLARSSGAPIVVVLVDRHRVPSPHSAADPALALRRRKAAEHILDAARGVLADVPDVTFRVVAETSAARALHDIALRAAAAVIVVGSTHRRGLGRVLAGTTAEHLLHDATCAIAVAPAGYASADPGTTHGVVGAAVDGGDDTERVTRAAARIARRGRSTLRLLTVVDTHARDRLDPAEGRRGGMRDATRRAAESALRRATLVAGTGVSVECLMSEGVPADRLIAESSDLDLLVIGSRGRGPLRRLVLGSVTGTVAGGAACPVLAIPHRVPELVDASVVAVAWAGAAR